MCPLNFIGSKAKLELIIDGIKREKIINHVFVYVCAIQAWEFQILLNQCKR